MRDDARARAGEARAIAEGPGGGQYRRPEAGSLHIGAPRATSLLALLPRVVRDAWCEASSPHWTHPSPSDSVSRARHTGRTTQNTKLAALPSHPYAARSDRPE